MATEQVQIAQQPSKHQLMLDIDQAKKAPHIEIVPLSDQQLAAIIRPEINIERHTNFIFPHRKAANLNAVREKSWRKKLPDNREVE